MNYLLSNVTKRNVWGQERRICNLISGIKELFSGSICTQTYHLLRKKHLLTWRRNVYLLFIQKKCVMLNSGQTVCERSSGWTFELTPKSLYSDRRPSILSCWIPRMESIRAEKKKMDTVIWHWQGVGESCNQLWVVTYILGKGRRP